MRILVVSDDRGTTDSIAETLRRNGHHALPLYRAVEAVEHAEELTFDVAILGPSWWPSGDSLAKTLRELMPRCKVVRCVERNWAGLYRALDAEFGYLAVDKKRRRRAVKRTSKPTNPGSLQPTHTFKVEELLDQLDEIRIQKVLDSQFGSQWNVSPLFIRRGRVL